MAEQNIAITTDSVILHKSSEALKILLVQRKSNPFEGKWALPGGFLEEDEPLEAGAKRELQEETGLKIEYLEQIKAWGTPGRDPRGRTITIAFLGVVEAEEAVEGSDDASDAQWFDVRKLPSLAFDHDEIVSYALKHYQNL